mmetsp:Transcript_76449/g.139860  ORF Transcript_76449/g.139860 Transcript_76449/m.139860 type:complete len:203 (+) Transcript_76449:1800-2408(+)
MPPTLFICRIQQKITGATDFVCKSFRLLEEGHSLCQAKLMQFVDDLLADGTVSEDVGAEPSDLPVNLGILLVSGQRLVLSPPLAPPLISLGLHICRRRRWHRWQLRWHWRRRRGHVRLPRRSRTLRSTGSFSFTLSACSLHQIAAGVLDRVSLALHIFQKVESSSHAQFKDCLNYLARNGAVGEDVCAEPSSPLMNLGDIII